MSLDSLAARIQRFTDVTRPRWQLIQGNCLDVVPTLGARRFRCIVTSPPYFGLRKYDIPDQTWTGATDHEHVWQSSTRPGQTGGTASAKVQIKGQDNFQIVAPSEQAVCTYCVEHGCDHEWSWSKSPGARTSDTKPGPLQHDGNKNREQLGGNLCVRCKAWQGQLGLEPTPEQYIQHLVEIFRACRDALTDDGTMFLVLGDSFVSTAPGTRNAPQVKGSKTDAGQWANDRPRVPSGLKPKDLMMIPVRVALALQADGWWLRSSIIWEKPAVMPESVTDRPTKSYEYVFLLAKSARYFYNLANATEPTTESTRERLSQPGLDEQAGSLRANGGAKTNGPMRVVGDLDTRQIRDVWRIGTEPTKHAHYAAMPTALAARCIALGSRPGDEVLDPFCGIGRSGIAALRLRRSFVGVDLGKDYLSWASQTLSAIPGARPSYDMTDTGPTGSPVDSPLQAK